MPTVGDKRTMANGMNSDVRELVKQIIGKPCSRREVGRMRSLSLGFGNEGRVSKISKTVYKEWRSNILQCLESCSRGIVLCGSQDVVDSIDELNLSLGRIGLGRFMSLRQFSDLDVRIEFDSGVAVDFLATTSDDDECLHIFCPGERCIEFSVRGGWKAGPSDRRWPEKRASLKPKQRP